MTSIAPTSATLVPSGPGLPPNDPAIAAYSQPGFPPQQNTGTPAASLYVGELDPAVSEAMLFELFNQIGPVASIRVCRDAVTRRSLGYAYVNYHNHNDADRALEDLNYAPIKGRPIRVMWSQRDPSVRRNGSGNIFIKNLDPLIDSKALHDTFSAFGNILSCKVAMDENGSKGYGFVHFETNEAADNAIQHVNGMLLNDRKVFVGHHVSRKERISKIEEMKSQFTNIYVKNLDEEVTDEEFRTMFEAFGSITSAVITRDENGKSKGFGFVNYESHDAAAAAVDAMHEKSINEKQLYVSRAQKKFEREEELRKQYEKLREEKLSKYQGVNLYVKNLDDTIDDEKLRQEFSVFGTITSAKVMKDDKTGISRGFGFVCFSSPDEATKAVTEMNGRMIANKPIYVALAQRKEVRRQQLAAQIQQRSQMRMQPPVPGMPGFPTPGMFYPGQAMPANGRGMFFQTPMVRPRWQGAQPVPYNAAMPYANQSRPVRPRPNNGRPMVGGPRPAPAASASMANRGKGGFKYVSNAKNTTAAVAQDNDQGKSPLNAAYLASLPAEQQKRTLGEALFHQIHPMTPEYASKITGMLLEMDNSELLHLLETPESLNAKIEEAIEVLEQHAKEMANQAE